MKIKRRMININNNMNISINKENELLKPCNVESIEIIPPIALLKTKIKNSNNKIGIILEEKEEYNISYKILEMIKSIQKPEKINKLYIYKYFFDILKKISNSNKIPLSHKKIFKKVQNNFQKLNDIDITKISNNIIQDNDNNNSIKEYNNSENEAQNLKIRKKKLLKNQLWKRNRF